MCSCRTRSCTPFSQVGRHGRVWLGLTCEPSSGGVIQPRKSPPWGGVTPLSSPHLPYRCALNLQADLLPAPGPAGPGLFEDLPAPAQLAMPRHSSAALPGASAQLPLPPPPPHAVYAPSAHALAPGAATFAPPAPHVGLDAAGWRGRITFYCIAESFDRKKAEELLRRTYPPGAVRSFPDAFHVEYIKWVWGTLGGHGAQHGEGRIPGNMHAGCASRHVLAAWGDTVHARWSRCMHAGCGTTGLRRPGLTQWHTGCILGPCKSRRGCHAGACAVFQSCHVSVLYD